MCCRAMVGFGTLLPSPDTPRKGRKISQVNVAPPPERMVPRGANSIFTTGSNSMTHEIRPIRAVENAVEWQRATIGQRPSTRVLKVAELCIDPAYQRELSSKSLRLIRKLVEEWDWRRFKVPVVTRVDEQWHVIDGQHTAIAAVTHGGIEELEVLVVEAGDRSDRAGAFIGHNKDRVQITNSQLFFAAAAAGDEDVLTALQICERAGALVLRNPSPGRPFRPGELIAIAALMQLVKRRTTVKARTVIETLARAKAAPITADLIKAVDMILHDRNYGEVDPDEIVAAFEKYGSVLMAKSVELALAKAIPRSRAMGVVLYQHTRKRKPVRPAELNNGREAVDVARV